MMSVKEEAVSQLDINFIKRHADLLTAIAEGDEQARYKLIAEAMAAQDQIEQDQVIGYIQV